MGFIYQEYLHNSALYIAHRVFVIFLGVCQYNKGPRHVKLSSCRLLQFWQSGIQQTFAICLAMTMEPISERVKTTSIVLDFRLLP